MTDHDDMHWGFCNDKCPLDKISIWNLFVERSLCILIKNLAVCLVSFIHDNWPFAFFTDIATESIKKVYE